MFITLNNCELDRDYIICDINKLSGMRYRFNDMGIIPGISIKKIFNSPFGGISAYSVMGSVIAIRDSDAKDVMVNG